MTFGHVYVASPLGFNVPGRHYAEAVLLPRLVGEGWSVLDPWADDHGIVATTLGLPPGPGPPVVPGRMSSRIGERNRKLIDQADAVLAILDGPDVDSGTAAEIGWAAALGKPVVGWRSDFRLSEHEASRINIQVADFIAVSGGCLVTTIDAAMASLAELRALYR
jgi:nucleoside 2-deoxyribosyltransferase